MYMWKRLWGARHCLGLHFIRLGQSTAYQGTVRGVIDYCYSRKTQFITGCGANAHRILWESTGTNPMRESFMVYLLSLKLDILNQSNEPTFYQITWRNIKKDTTVLYIFSLIRFILFRCFFFLIPVLMYIVHYSFFFHTIVDFVGNIRRPAFCLIQRFGN